MHHLGDTSRPAPLSFARENSVELSEIFPMANSAGMSHTVWLVFHVHFQVGDICRQTFGSKRTSGLSHVARMKLHRTRWGVERVMKSNIFSDSALCSFANRLSRRMDVEESWQSIIRWSQECWCKLLQRAMDWRCIFVQHSLCSSQTYWYPNCSFVGLSKR